MASITANEYPEWTATTPKRKRTLRDTVSALRTTTEPPMKQPKKDTPAKKETPTINWSERKSLLQSYSNKAYVDIIMTEVLAIFNELAAEFRKDPSETGPSMLWHLLPSFMEAIQSTPWGWFDVIRKDPETSSESLLFFVNYTYGDRGQDLSVSQNKFRMVILGKAKSAVLGFLRKYFSSQSIDLVYAEKFFKGKE